MEIRIDPLLVGFGRKPFTMVGERFDLGRGIITVRGHAVAGYCTVIPISDAGYRKHSPTKARAEYWLADDQHCFLIWDDWGDFTQVMISDDEEGRALAMRQIESLKTNALLTRR